MTVWTANSKDQIRDSENCDLTAKLWSSLFIVSCHESLQVSELLECWWTQAVEVRGRGETRGVAVGGENGWGWLFVIVCLGCLYLYVILFVELYNLALLHMERSNLCVSFLFWFCLITNLFSRTSCPSFFFFLNPCGTLWSSNLLKTLPRQTSLLNQILYFEERKSSLF